MTNDKNPWVNRKSYSDDWLLRKELSGGGQGRVGRARRKRDGRLAFLKVIKAKKNMERRRRFSREANAYDTIRALGIPRLIESNAHRWEDDEFEPYIATDFIEGPTLRRWREKQTYVALPTAIKAVRKLLTILRVCHANGVVHRDIKPNNIILADGDPSCPVLLDFGLSYHKIEDDSSPTFTGQEVGNRFLRLPELSAGSRIKQDPRSDVSFVAGILFYLLTGQNPAVLLDAQGRLPHQRNEQFARIEQTAGNKAPRLLAVFDNAFDPVIAHRYTNAEAMIEALDGVMRPRTGGRSPGDLRQEIRDMMDTEVAKRQAETHRRLNEALQEIQRVHETVRQSLKIPLVTVQGGWNVSEGRGYNTLRWRRTGSDDDLLSVMCEVREAGDEIVISLSREPVFRTSISDPSYDGRFDDAVRDWLLYRLHDTLYNPYTLPPEAHYFGEQQPVASLEDARDEASRRGLSILAFVYDPTEKKRSKLEHHLRYFLENRKTRETINAAFIVALVPLSQVAVVTDILNNESMESARWIVFDQDLVPIKQEVIYANPQEGERIATKLASQFGP